MNAPQAVRVRETNTIFDADTVILAMFRAIM